VTFDRTVVGDVLLARGDLKGAIAAYEAGIAEDERALGPTHPRLAFDHQNLGAALLAGGDPSAETHFKSAIAILGQSARPREVVPILNGLAVLHAASGKLDDALTDLDGALRAAEMAWGPEHPEIAMLHLRAGLVLRKKGDLPGALPRMRRA